MQRHDVFNQDCLLARRGARTEGYSHTGSVHYILVMASQNSVIGNRVCVVGAGMIGLVATKNLLEQGLEVTTFERNGYVGGTWHASLDTTQTSALPITTANVSKQSVRPVQFVLAELEC